MFFCYEQKNIIRATHLGVYRNIKCMKVSKHINKYGFIIDHYEIMIIQSNILQYPIKVNDLYREVGCCN